MTTIEMMFVTKLYRTEVQSAAGLRHEVPLNQAKEDRIAVSFNCRW